MRRIWIDGLSWLHRFVRHAVAGFHEVAVEFLVEHLDFDKPFARSRTDPAGYQGAGRKSMMLGQRGPVHLRRHQRVCVHCFFNGNAADERRHFPGDFVEAMEHYMFAGWLQSCPLQQILQTRTRESAGAHCSFLQRTGLKPRSEEHTSELQSLAYLVCRLLLE